MSAGISDSERWSIFEHVLEDASRQTSALCALVWLTRAWPDVAERDALVDASFRALPDDIAEGAMGWALDLLDEAIALASAHGHALSDHACAYLGALLVWSWRVGGGRLERCTFEFVDGVTLPARFVPDHPRRKSANDIATVRFELLAGRLQLEPLSAHEPGYWIARASVAPSRPGALFRTYSGEQTSNMLSQLGWPLDVRRDGEPFFQG